MRTRIIRNDADEFCRMSWRANRVIIRKDFRNGDKYTLVFSRFRVSIPGDPILYHWCVSLFVGDFRRADGWRRTFKSTATTGSGNLHCMISAREQIRWFVRRLGRAEELLIGATDTRRANVYSRLLRLPEFVYRDGMVVARNPEIWEWIEQ